MSPSAKTNVRRLAVARAISLTGSAAAYLALVDWIFVETGSSRWVAAVLLATEGVSGLVGPVTGALGDRFDRRRVMIVSDLSSAAFFLAMSFAGTPGLMLALGFGSAVSESPFWSASGAAIPNLVESDDDISWANGLIAVGRNAGITIGPMLGGVLVAVLDARWVFAINALSFVVSAALVSSVRGRFSGERGEEEKHGGLAAGVVFLARDRVLRRITMAWVVLVAGTAAVMVADRPLAELFGAGSLGFGAIISCWGAGSIVGSLAGRRMSQRTEPVWLVAGTGLVAAGGLGTWLSPVFWPILAFSFTWGFGDALSLVAEQGIRQRRTPDEVRSRVMAAADGAVHATMAVGFMASGFLIESLGAQGVYGLGGAASGIAALLLLPLIGVLRRSGSLVAEEVS